MTIAMLAVLGLPAIAQSRRAAAAKPADSEGTVISVAAWRTDGKTDPIKAENLYLYENGVEQHIKNFSYDASPAKIVILVDNSQTVPADVETLKKATMEFAYEIFEGDELFVLAYDEKAEIVQEWTDDAKKLEASVGSFRKKGNPYLFDALHSTVLEVLKPLMPGTRKTAVVVIGDGLDRGSSRSFDKTLNELQDNNVTLYFLQMPDRTLGAYRRDQPKAPMVISQLAEGTGGKVFDIGEAQTAAKLICEELRKNRYLIAYDAVNTSSFDARRLYVSSDVGIVVRAKAAQPPNIK